MKFSKCIIGFYGAMIFLLACNNSGKEQEINSVNKKIPGVIQQELKIPWNRIVRILAGTQRNMADPISQRINSQQAKNEVGFKSTSFFCRRSYSAKVDLCF